ncbi:family 78 glycoside hydrolase catalytic domain [Massilibacteroides sp.]|uniref:family 78 glycoside hydrolase catalytic domain n=1 Tax=Massilibacteroides sp. TaxID=2034766 RepID=UPI0026116F01|nr:family 78 glycoside hydrolase catalytic domain [Massilibacteroides sp.]MDD4515219.1 family 78 glycoside hydrolase catalytic domain [Massilibacteroides sp.]
MIKKIFIATAGILLILNSCVNNTVPVNLRTDYLTEPLGLDASNPRFTWEYSGDDEHFTPNRYEIKIGTNPKDLQTYENGMKLKPHTRYYWQVEVWDQNGDKSRPSEITWFETAKLSSSDWNGQWITDSHDKEFEPAPLFRKQFTAEKEIKNARLYVAAAGYYELFLNGHRVGENYLDPGYTHFDKRILYVTHDVTSDLKKGDNALAAVLGNGWYNEQSVAVWNFHEARWRDRPRMLCELRITYADNSEETIVTDDSWKTSTGAYTYNNLYSGDQYDARLEEEGWKTASFDDSQWNSATLTSSPAPLLAAQQMPGIHIVDEIQPTNIKAFSDTLYVYSFPENISGLCRLKVKGEAGTRITLKHGELLKEDGRLEQGNINVYYKPVKPGEVFQMDVYTLKGGEEEIFMPSFAYHGFQYVEVESSRPIQMGEGNLTALFMHTDVAPVGNFSCSNPLLNKIWNATMQAYRSNLHSIPTDCPQREKNGWTADAHVSIDLGLLGFDGITLYEKWMNDFIDNQTEAGDISGIIPSSGWGYGKWIGPVWDAAMFIIPDALYKYYNDTQAIERLYPTMEKYLDYLKTQEENGMLTYGLGDWVYWKATTPNNYTSTAYYYLDYTLMAKFAALLGKDATPYQKKAEELKNLINDNFFNEETGVYANGTQTAQALALYLHLAPSGKRQLVADKLHEIVAANDYFLDFGLIGSKTVPAMLTKYGYVEDVMKMVTKTDAPSWGYWVETMGYTTLPETWTLSPEFRDASLNHVFMGDISAWMMNYLAGIQYDEDKPGFTHINIEPHFVEGLDWAHGEYHSVKGIIRSEWKREGERYGLSVTIPVGCTATILVEEKEFQLEAGTHQLLFR